MPTIAEELRNQGRAEGRAEGHVEGHVEGRAEGLRAGLRLQLGLKFGELLAEHERRIEEASIDDLERLVARLVLADSIEAVFGPGE
jgi:predicted transposase YdaD